jgi:hypothetical protein
MESGPKALYEDVWPGTNGSVSKRSLSGLKRPSHTPSEIHVANQSAILARPFWFPVGTTYGCHIPSCTLTSSFTQASTCGMEPGSVNRYGQS